MFDGRPVLPTRLLRASAGTGKTYQLVQIYASLVLEHRVRPMEIVGITFTRKAAAELKDRIRVRLQHAHVSQTVLAELARAPLSNFHVLALQLLSTYSLAAGIPEHQEILGEKGEDFELFVEACEHAWLADADDLTRKSVMALSRYFAVDDELPGALWQAINRARENGASPYDVTALFGASYDPWVIRKRLSDEIACIRTRYESSLDVLTATTRKTMQEFLDAPMPHDGSSHEEWTSMWHDAGKGLSRRGKLSEVVRIEDKDLLTQRVFDVLADERCALLVAPLQHLVGAAWRRYEWLKHERRTVDFGDIVSNAVNMLANHKEIREDVRKRVRAVLVDEAQDTNLLQRRFVHLLAGLEGDDDRGSPAALCVVGDRKQAIYTFRGADPSGFDAFEQDIKNLEGDQITLSVSRRSTYSLVRGINSIGLTLFATNYDALESLDTPLADDAGITWVETTGDGKGEDIVLEEASQLASYVVSRLHAGDAPSDFCLLLATMTMAPLYAEALRRMGVPVQTGGGGGLYACPEIIDMIHLLAWLVDPEDPMAAAVALRSPIFALDDELWFALIRGGSAAGMMRGEIPAYGEVLTDIVNSLVLLRSKIATMRVIDFLSLMDETLGLRALVRARPEGAQAASNVDRWFDMGAACGARGGTVFRFAREQIRRLRSGYDEPVAQTSGNKEGPLILMSVHQSKGLQFPIVLMPGLRRRGKNDTERLRYDRHAGVVFKPRGGDGFESSRFRDAALRNKNEKEQEKRRLLYVAMTRAERELIFFGPADGKGADKGDGFARYLESWFPHALEKGLVKCVQPPTDVMPWHREISHPEKVADTIYIPARIADTQRHFEMPVTSLIELFYVGALREAPLGETLMRAVREPPLQKEQSAYTPSELGDIVHAILAELPALGLFANVDDFLDAQRRRLGLSSHDAQIKKVGDDLKAFITHGEGAELTAIPVAQRRHELPFRLPITGDFGVLTVVGQIDVLVEDLEGLRVIDFKYGKPNAEAMAKYRMQLMLYALAVGAVRTQLMFPRGGDVPEHRTWQFSSEDLLACKNSLQNVGAQLAASSLLAAS